MELKELFELIEARRLLLGYSKRELASKAEITDKYYWQIVTGQATGAAYNVVLRLSEAVGLSFLVYIKP